MDRAEIVDASELVQQDLHGPAPQVLYMLVHSREAKERRSCEFGTVEAGQSNVGGNV
jgi:hypothetical protein